MVFFLTTDQESLKQVIVRFFEGVCSSERRRTRINNTTTDELFWKGCKELGLFELFEDPESSSMIELSMLAFEAGRFLSTEDISSAIFFGPFLSRRDAEYKKTLEAAGKSGSVGFGILVNSSTVDFIPHVAQKVIYCDATFQNFQAASSEHGSTHGSIDITRNYKRVDSIKGQALSSTGALKAGLCILKASELSGICAAVTEMTRSFCLTRKQFGVEVGAFQAVQQRLADMYVKSEALWSLAQFAAWSYDNSSSQRERAGYAALNYALQEATSVVEGAIQLHGGIGFTWEHDLHLYLRRVKLNVALFGSNWDHANVLLT